MMLLLIVLILLHHSIPRGTDLNGERKPYDKPRTSSYKKPSSDFFGTYLGNSKDNQDKE